jgi:hypothetical protein
MNPSIIEPIVSLPARRLLYLDPGSGSFLLQILIAAGMSVLFVLGLFRKKIADFFSRLLGRKTAGEAGAGDDSDDD